jgi:hypothetical protein
MADIDRSQPDFVSPFDRLEIDYFPNYHVAEKAVGRHHVLTTKAAASKPVGYFMGRPVDAGQFHEPLIRDLHG